jgi:site-specific DNA-methyltransferase (adenine-specific)
MNKLYFGDNLEILKSLYKEHPQGFIDLIYIDPPFNSKRNYNVLFESVDMADTKAQKEAFADTWSNVSYMDTLNEILELNKNLYDFLKALDKMSNNKSSVSYLTTMTIRLIYMHKLLKDTGSFYLHCDTTMSHYLKMICDFIFSEKNFRNEIIWKRTNSKGLAFTRMAQNHDSILYYSKSDKMTFNIQYLPHDEKYLSDFYKYTEPDTGRIYRLGDLTNPNKDRPNLTYEFLGITRVWRWTKERMEEAYKNGIVVQTKPGAVPALKRYLDEQEGTPVDDCWMDIANVQSSKEKLGYPTQKPLELLERIIKASSNEGDVVADFFCGCGTTITVAERLKRQWVGVDISHLAVKLMANRLINAFGKDVKTTFEIFGFPKDIDSAKELAENTSGGRLKFEEWIVEVMLHGILNENKNQMGYDGYFTFDVQGEKQIGMIEVKSGGATSTQLNHFIKTVESKNGSIGVFVCFEKQITKNMRIIAKDEGFYNEAVFGHHYPKIQIISVESLVNGDTINIPISTKTTFKVAPKEISVSKQHKLDI